MSNIHLIKKYDKYFKFYFENILKKKVCYINDEVYFNIDGNFMHFEKNRELKTEVWFFQFILEFVEENKLTKNIFEKLLHNKLDLPSAFNDHDNITSTIFGINPLSDRKNEAMHLILAIMLDQK